MGRPIRLTAPNTYYHITIRSNNSEPLISSNSDFNLFVSSIIRYKNKFKFKLFAYCVMNSHIHLFIQTPNNHSASISKIMHGICWRFAYSYNRAHNRKGHFFGDRFKSTIVETERYSLTLLRYITQNPVRAGLVKNAKDWLWSSYRVYADGINDPIIDLLPSFEGLAAERKIAARMFREMVETHIMPKEESWSKSLVVGDSAFVIKTLTKFGLVKRKPPS